MSAADTIVVAPCPTCSTLAQAIQTDDRVSYRALPKLPPEPKLFWVFSSEYPEDGSEVVTAADADAAEKMGMKFLGFDDQEDVGSRPVTEQDIDFIREYIEKDSGTIRDLLKVVRQALPLLETLRLSGPAMSDPKGPPTELINEARAAIAKAEDRS